MRAGWLTRSLRATRFVLSKRDLVLWPDGCYWHLADISMRSSNVCFEHLVVGIRRFQRVIATAGVVSFAVLQRRAAVNRKKKRRLAKQTVVSLSTQGTDLDCSRLAIMNANSDPLSVRSADPFPGADAEGRPFWLPPVR